MISLLLIYSQDELGLNMSKKVINKSQKSRAGRDSIMVGRDYSSVVRSNNKNFIFLTVMIVFGGLAIALFRGQDFKLNDILRQDSVENTQSGAEN